MKNGRIRVIILWLTDMLCISVGWFLVVNLYHIFGFGVYHTSDYLKIWSVIPIFTVINCFGRLYCGRFSYPGMPIDKVEEFRRLILSAIVSHLVIIAGFAFYRNSHSTQFGEIAVSSIQELSRAVFICSAVFAAGFSQIFRNFVRSLMKRYDVGQIPAYIIGGGDVADGIAKVFGEDSYFGIKIVGRFQHDDPDGLLEAARRNDIKHLFCCFKDNRYFSAELKNLTAWFSFIEYLPTAHTFPVADARAIAIDGFGGIEMVNLQRMQLLRVEKRLLDLALSVIIGLCAVPFFIVVPILIKLTSKGPVFYKAKRLGKMGRTIYVWKFRSMYVDADERLESLLASDPELAAEFKANFKLKNDPRVTPLGKILRKTSIDELPQLINVFTHDMALIGPRPIVEKEIPYYGKAYELFSSVKPGITGLWQASGRSNTDYPTRVALDVRYILNWSPWLDLWIVFRTAAAVLRFKGSY